MSNPPGFDELVRDAEEHSFSGWDFSYIEPKRYQEGVPTWDYRNEVLGKMPGVRTLLDMSTGGGEFLSSLRPFPEQTFATESYVPNISVAINRLQPLGVKVVKVLSETELPFADNYFNLVTNRHGDYSPREVHRILSDGGTFITQQVGGRNNIEINKSLQQALHGRITLPYGTWNLAHAVQELEETGFQIIKQKEEYPKSAFYDIGALVYYLEHIPWQIPDFSPRRYRKQLLEIHKTISEGGKFSVTSHRFFIEAKK